MKLEKIGDGKSLEFKDNDEYLKLQCQWMNEEQGDLNSEDGVECELCRNKGFIAVIEDNFIKYKDCECKPKRKIAKRLKNCGVSDSMLQHYTFSNYKVNDKWQEITKNIFLDYSKDIFNGKTYWIYISGITGSGKTHLSVAAFQKIIKSGKHLAEYMNWNEESLRLISLSKSYDTEEYDKRLLRLQSVQLLYIDDFMKLTDSKFNRESISLAFRILDYRYRNDLPTMISSELSLEELSEIDSAVARRISEKANNGNYIIDLSKNEERKYKF